MIYMTIYMQSCISAFLPIYKPWANCSKIIINSGTVSCATLVTLFPGSHPVYRTLVQVMESWAGDGNKATISTYYKALSTEQCIDTPGAFDPPTNHARRR